MGILTPRVSVIRRIILQSSQRNVCDHAAPGMAPTHSLAECPHISSIGEARPPFSPLVGKPKATGTSVSRPEKSSGRKSLARTNKRGGGPRCVWGLGGEGEKFARRCVTSLLRLQVCPSPILVRRKEVDEPADQSTTQAAQCTVAETWPICLVVVVGSSYVGSLPLGAIKPRGNWPGRRDKQLLPCAATNTSEGLRQVV